MHINPWGILFSYGVIFIVITVACMLLLTLLHDMNMFRFKSRSGYVLWGIAAGLLVTFIFVLLTFKSNTTKGTIVIPPVSKVNKQ